MQTPATNDQQPLVSIIVPSYNQGQYLRETLASILSQDYRPLEVLVLDGASKDDTVPILKEFSAKHPELRWWSEPDSGVADAVNKGLALARGEFAGIQSSDDIYLPGAISEAAAILQNNVQLGIVCAEINIVDESGRFLQRAPLRLPFTMERFLSRNTIIHQSSAFFRLELGREVGGWNPRCFCADTEMWLRMSFRTQVLKVDRVWSAWRKHEAQRDKEAIKVWHAWTQMIEESEDLKRAPLRLRLAARAGCHLVALRYNPGRSRWFKTAQAWLALLTYPPSYAGIYPKAVLFPGLGRMRHWAHSWTSTQAPK
jgi:glycosyltransferase involved in cell wall biosynthesis